MRTILITTGTSLLTNARRDLKLDREPTDQELANYLAHTPPDKASAETNSLHRLLQADDHLVLICSQTPEGNLCARALKSHYQNQGVEADTKEIIDLNYKETRFKMRGLRSLVSTFCDLIRRERQLGRQVLINATGGFKAEIAYAVVVGLLFNVPVYYIHEAFRDIIEMPPTPISWDYSLIATHESFFQWLNEELRPTPEVDKRLRALPQEIRFLLTEEDGYTFLSPAGEAFYEAYQWRSQQPAVKTSPAPGAAKE
jgi:putative CRISPR-associated protein (TIGR02619 family)